VGNRMGYAVFAIIVAVLLVGLFFMRGRRRA
jgi:hypothetical protein